MKREKPAVSLLKVVLPSSFSALACKSQSRMETMNNVKEVSLGHLPGSLKRSAQPLNAKSATLSKPAR